MYQSMVWCIRSPDSTSEPRVCLHRVDLVYTANHREIPAGLLCSPMSEVQ